ncbi:MAG: heavy metal translocating P-type ATPase, partial [Deltaproteobacteria bacterium HGW-Deltaproteobacteria-20]
MDLSPQMARVRLNGELAMLDVSSVMPGTTIVVRPGERVALDGIVVRGSSAVDESPITGESVPADKSEGDRVFAGTLNASGLLEVQTTTLAADSTLSRIVYLVEEAQGSRAPSQTFVERFSRWYTPLVIWLALGVAVVPPLVAAFLGVQWGPWSEWVRRALVMLVVSCPCALVISTPVSIVSAITRASRDGVLVKGGAFLEAAAEVQAIAFDKTGTLTLGKARVVGVEPFGDRSEAGVLAVAAALEGHSNHPIARAVVSALEEVGSRPAGVVVEEYQEEPGVGVSGLISGVRWEICSPACAHERGTGNTAEPLRRADEAEQQGRTVLALLEAGEIAGLLSIVDGIRPQSAAAIAALKRGGIEHRP